MRAQSSQIPDDFVVLVVFATFATFAMFAMFTVFDTVKLTVLIDFSIKWMPVKPSPTV